MSNIVHIVSTQFTDLNNPDVPLYGVRIYDDYGRTYVDFMPEKDVRLPDLDLLRLLVSDPSHLYDENENWKQGIHLFDYGNQFEEMLDSVVEEEMEIEINGNRYMWEEISEILTS